MRLMRVWETEGFNQVPKWNTHRPVTLPRLRGPGMSDPGCLKGEHYWIPYKAKTVCFDCGICQDPNCPQCAKTKKAQANENYRLFRAKSLEWWNRNQYRHIFRTPLGNIKGYLIKGRVSPDPSATTSPIGSADQDETENPPKAPE